MCKALFNLYLKTCPSVDVHFAYVYHDVASGRLGDRGPVWDRGKSALQRARRRIASGAGKPAGLGPQKQTAAYSTRSEW